MDKLRWLGISCPVCGQELNSWDVRCSKAVGYLKYQVCEHCGAHLDHGEKCDCQDER